MQIITCPQKMQEIAKQLKAQGKNIVLVPTMGALHEGHLRLMDRARELGGENGVVVASIFVNPTQFGPNEDFAKYPREFENDCKKCEQRAVDFVFAPNVEAMYPEKFDSRVNVGKITTVLEGAIRPGHFDGVCVVVLKLFNITLADAAVFGQKDAQQVMVIKAMVRDLNVPVKIDVYPIVREDDGLAKSSRNVYLTTNERLEVSKIYEGLQKLQEFAQIEKNCTKLKDFLKSYYCQALFFAAEYVEITDLGGSNIDKIDNECVLVSVAVRTAQSKTRLIDNIMWRCNNESDEEN